MPRIRVLATSVVARIRTTAAVARVRGSALLASAYLGLAMWLRELADTASTSEALAFTAGKTLSDTTSPGDALTVTTGKALPSDAVSPSDSASIQPGKGLNDTATTGESGRLFFNDYATDYFDPSGEYVGTVTTF